MNNIKFNITKKIIINQQCYLYEKKKPCINDIVTFKPTRINDMGVYVYLK